MVSISANLPSGAPGAEPGPDHPLDHWFSSHRVLETKLRLLARAEGQLDSPKKAHARSQVEALVTFLEAHLPLHIEDEEISIFARLRGRLTGREEEALDLLEEQHRISHRLQSALRGAVEEYKRKPGKRSAEKIRVVVCELLDLYRRHIRLEDQVILRAAHRVLTAVELASIAGEMKQRRAA
jgi:hemerythrin-like domain-containing protein